jgi:cysteine desulfurase/selenocysteine lyase
MRRLAAFPPTLAVPDNCCYRRLAVKLVASFRRKWLMAPKGTGLLYVSSEASAAIQPIQWQDGRRYGAESAGVGPQPLVIGLGAAIAASS